MVFGKKRSTAKTEKSEESTQTPPAAEQPAMTPPVPEMPAGMRLDESKLLAAYANFARVTGTPEEVLLDFGLNPEPFGIPANPIGISERIVVNFFTAKRLLAALQMTLQRHETAFGIVETDVQKRLAQPAR